MDSRELSDAELEVVTAGMAKVAVKAAVGGSRPALPVLRAAAAPIRSLFTKPARSCSGGTCSA